MGNLCSTPDGAARNNTAVKPAQVLRNKPQGHGYDEDQDEYSVIMSNKEEQHQSTSDLGEILQKSQRSDHTITSLDRNLEKPFKGCLNLRVTKATLTKSKLEPQLRQLLSTSTEDKYEMKVNVKYCENKYNGLSKGFVQQ
jgi:hypothetical protein